MTAVPALAPLRIVPVPGPQLQPTPLPGQLFSGEADDSRFVQEPFDFAGPASPPDEDTPDGIHPRGTDGDLDGTAEDARPASRALSTDQDPAEIIRPLATALVEVLAGRRPVVQLVRWTSPTVYAALSSRATVAYRRRLTHPGGPVRVTVRRIVLTRPREGVAEVSIVVIDGNRVRAVAISLGIQAGRWIIEALQVG